MSPDPQETSALSAQLLDSSFELGGSARLDLQTSSSATELIADIYVLDAVDLRSLYVDLSYDPVQLRPLQVEMQDGLCGPDERLDLALLPGSGRGCIDGLISLGQTMIHPQSRPGLRGRAWMARLHFARLQAGALPQRMRMASMAPVSDASAAMVNYSAGMLTWGYCSQGDYNQDGQVLASDLTPIGIHFQADVPAGDKNSVLSVVDGNGDGKILASDLTPIGVNFRSRVQGYRVYGGDGIDDKPAGNGDPSPYSPIIEVPLTAAIGNPALQRLQYSQDVSASPAAYYWVRPFDSEGEGTCSVYPTEQPVNALTIFLTNPPAIGSGTQSDPYVANVFTDYIFNGQHPTEGDVTQRLFYYDSPNGFAREDAALRGKLNFWDHQRGDVEIYAEGSYDLGYERSNSLWFRLPPIGWSAATVTEFGLYDDALELIPGEDVTWIDEQTGYCLRNDGSQWESWADIYKTYDGGSTFNKLGRADAQNGGQGAGLYVTVLPGQIWHSSYFSGWGIAGTAAVSYDDAQSWLDRHVEIQSAWDDNPTDGILPSYPIAKISQQGSRMWAVGGEYRPYVAWSEDGSVWQGLRLNELLGLNWIDPLVTPSWYMLRGTNSGGAAYYRFNGSSFEEWTGNLPAGVQKDYVTWANQPYTDYLTMLETRWDDPDRYLFTSNNGGQSCQVIYEPNDIPASSPANPRFLLRYGLVVDANTAYVVGDYAEDDYNWMIEVYRTSDAGSSWNLEYVRYNDGRYLIPSLDYSGGVHMNCCWLYQDSYPYYTGQIYLGQVD